MSGGEVGAAGARAGGASTAPSGGARGRGGAVYPQAVAATAAFADRDGDDGRHAVRLGLCTVRGMGPAQEQGVRAALASLASAGPFTSSADFARRSGVGRRVMEHLARLGALGGFATRRRQALWEVAALAHQAPGPLAAILPPEAGVELPAMSVAEELEEDYRMGGASTSRHPLALLRPRLDGAGVLPARQLSAAAARSVVAVAGMVICRQRPPTAGGLTFVTVEDETGFANLIVDPRVAEAQRLALRSSLLLAEGRVERADGVVNLRVRRLVSLADPDALQGLVSHDYR